MAYIIGNIKYNGTGNIFDIIPNKTTSGQPHMFSPPQQVALVGDMMLVGENKDFTDVNAYQIVFKFCTRTFKTGEQTTVVMVHLLHQNVLLRECVSWSTM